MAKYDEDYNYSQGGVRQKDLVLATNEFVYVQTRTNGQIKTYTGPIMLTISQQESLVVFNQRTKRFEETTDFEKARQLFISAPENWYVILKNPAKDNMHPEEGKATVTPDLCIGNKIIINGPCNFSLFPGQMAKVVRGHRLRSNQYLLAQVYDPTAASLNSATIVDSEGNEVESKEKYHSGQLLVIKGTEVSFYIPPTGIQVIKANSNAQDPYIRDAITLERLEYAILKDEDGNKRYCHGPAVVFPEPTETFVETPKGGNIFRALELSPISGIYVKVIAEYTDEKGVVHPVGEELFITGNDQMIYYPRPEHAMIQYDGKFMHHAIAIPEGEGRYVLNRLTGEINTVKGPRMYLPDPRTEVVVKRKLSKKECELFYPGNVEVMIYNEALTEKNVEKSLKNNSNMQASCSLDSLTSYATSNQASTLALFEANANISRGTSYTKPRTITLDTKYEGVVAIDVWTGYAINVTSKKGNREVVIGPTTRLLDYDETLEAIQLSKGTPKDEKNTISTAFLRVENNRISDIINIKTKDFVSVQISLSYKVDFDIEQKDKWFSIDNYVQYLCDKMRCLVAREAKKYSIEEFYANSTDIIRNVIMPDASGTVFPENGMVINDVEVLAVAVQSSIAKMLSDHQNEMIEKTISLSAAEKQDEVSRKLAEYEKAKTELDYNLKKMKLQLTAEYEKAQEEHKQAMALMENQGDLRRKEALLEQEKVVNEIQVTQNERITERYRVEEEHEKNIIAMETEKLKNQTEATKAIINAISPDLIAALTTSSHEQLLTTAVKSISPYALANGEESIADVVNKLTRGTSLENVINKVLPD